jgi:hypothetical protein
MTQPQVKLIGQGLASVSPPHYRGPIGGSSLLIGKLNFCEEFGQ